MAKPKDHQQLPKAYDKKYVKAERLDNDFTPTGVAKVFTAVNFKNMAKMKGLKWRFIESLSKSPSADQPVMCEVTGGSEFNRIDAAVESKRKADAKAATKSAQEKAAQDKKEKEAEAKAAQEAKEEAAKAKAEKEQAAKLAKAEKAKAKAADKLVSKKAESKKKTDAAESKDNKVDVTVELLCSTMVMKELRQACADLKIVIRSNWKEATLAGKLVDAGYNPSK